jgi:hypothetical protein
LAVGLTIVCVLNPFLSMDCTKHSITPTGFLRVPDVSMNGTCATIPHLHGLLRLVVSFDYNEVIYVCLNHYFVLDVAISQHHDL